MLRHKVGMEKHGLLHLFYQDTIEYFWGMMQSWNLVCSIIKHNNKYSDPFLLTAAYFCEKREKETGDVQT